MLRYVVTSALITVASCAKAPAPTNSERQPHRAEPAPSATSTHARSAPSSDLPVVREVPFDGGVARVEGGPQGAERVQLGGLDGKNLGESTCVGSLAGYDAVRRFFTAARSAILGGDVEQIASFMAFPLRVNDTPTRVVSTREQFISERARILTSDVTASVRNADPGQVFCTSQGVMLGNGVLWADVQPDNRLAIFVINLGPRHRGKRAK